MKNMVCEQCFFKFFFFSSSLIFVLLVDFALVKGWPKAKNVSFGQLSAVAFNDEGNVVVFHRGDHEWDEKSFWPNNTYARIEDGPIETNPVVVLSSATGEYVASWGAYRLLN